VLGLDADIWLSDNNENRYFALLKSKRFMDPEPDYVQISGGQTSEVKQVYNVVVGGNELHDQPKECSRNTC